MPALKNVTKANWESLKKNAGIKSAKWYEKAHADVGGAIDKMQKAQAKYLAAKTEVNIAGFNGALKDLDKAFAKFLAAKEFKSDLAVELQKKILGWKKEVSDTSDLLVAIYKKHEATLKNNGAKEMDKIFGQILG